MKRMKIGEEWSLLLVYPRQSINTDRLLMLAVKSDKLKKLSFVRFGSPGS
jgi:hypothetical protein